MKRVSIIAAAVATALTTGVAFAEEKAEMTSDGWSVNGYMSSNARVIDGASADTEFGRPDYKTAGTHGKSTNQVEFVIKKHSEYSNGVWADYVVRSEFGNGNSYAYSSDGDQKVSNDDGFAVKEAFVELGGILGDETSIWAGQRYLNRAAGILSGEFWKQSSGVGAGIQTKLAGKTAGIAYVMADPGDLDTMIPDADRKTLSSIDLYYYGIDAGIGSIDLDVKFGNKANTDEDGFGASVTLNSSYYGMDGWTQTALAYGSGVMQNRGVNFGNWSGGDDDAESIFFTSYGVMNVTEKFQLGTEVVYMAALDKLFGAEDLKRYMVAARPSYNLNQNVRLEATVSYGHEEGKDGYWTRSGDALESDIWNFEVATAFTVNADYFGRPQIKPYVSYIVADDEASAGIIGIDNGKDQVVVGVHTEIWF
ncbi:carbohydrate porin [Vibrio sp. HN007]|uniref:carbohydrate porin n=1 Tax=Vibrio iocasae TaxID=3098914 RepID=UPI0035D3DECC